MSALARSTTRAPAFGVRSISRRPSSVRRASRKGARPTPKRIDSLASERRCPAVSSPVSMARSMPAMASLTV